MKKGHRVVDLFKKKKSELDLIEFYGNDIAGLELIEQEKRDNFFLKYSSILGLVAFIFLYLSYRVFPSAAWQADFDPINIQFFFSTTGYPLPLFGWGMLLELIRTIFMLFILWLVIGKQFSNFALRTMVKKDNINLDTDKPSLGPLPFRKNLTGYVEFLWNKNWFFGGVVFFGVILYVMWSSSQYSAGNIYTQADCYPKQAFTTKIAKSISPENPNENQLCIDETRLEGGGFSSWREYYKTNALLWGLGEVKSDKLTLEVESLKDQNRPYYPYLIYCLINYFMIALVVVVHSYAYINTYAKGFRLYFLSRELFAQEATPNELLSKAKEDYTKLQFYLRHFLNPLGLLATLVLSLAAYDVVLGSITLSGAAKIIYFVVYAVVVFILIWNVWSILIQVDNWSKAILNKAKITEDEQVKTALEAQAENYSVDAIVAETRTSPPWILLAKLIKLLRKIKGL